MTRLAGATAMGAVFLLVGCAERLVDVPTHREPAVPVQLAEGPMRCPARTVLHGDDDIESGAGAVPGDFDGRTWLRCKIDYTTVRSRHRDRTLLGTTVARVGDTRASCGVEPAQP